MLPSSLFQASEIQTVAGVIKFVYCQNGKMFIRMALLVEMYANRSRFIQSNSRQVIGYAFGQRTPGFPNVLLSASPTCDQVTDVTRFARKTGSKFERAAIFRTREGVGFDDVVAGHTFKAGTASAAHKTIFDRPIYSTSSVWSVGCSKLGLGLED